MPVATHIPFVDQSTKGVSVDNRPYRPAVRVLIVRDNTVLVGKRMHNGKHVGYKFPGGGIEEGDTLEQTAIKEVLEEVGVEAKEVVNLKLYQKYDVLYKDPERAKIFRGGSDTWMAVRFLRENKKLLNSQGDSFPFTWQTFEQAKSTVRSYPKDQYTVSTLQAIDKAEVLLGPNKARLKPW